MFEIPGSDIVRVHVTAEAVRGDEPPTYHRGEFDAPALDALQDQEEDAQIELQIK